MLVMVLVFALYINSFLFGRNAEFSDCREKRERVMLLDSLIKRRSGGTMPGIAVFSPDKRRTLENRAVPLLVEHSKLKEIGLSELWAECTLAEHGIYRGVQGEGECEVYSRIVFLGSERCVLKAKFCGG